MRPFGLIKQLDSQSNVKRREMITAWLEAHNVPYRKQEYPSGINLIVDLGEGDKRVGVSSHFDRVPEAPGANDNASAVAVCLDVIHRWLEKGDERVGLRVFFFDEEETGLKGSAAYIARYGVKDMAWLINLELVGMGDKLAIWPVEEGASGMLLDTFESCAAERKVVTKRFDKIITHVADHLSFARAGLKDVFTITCISDKDIIAAERYYKALADGKSVDVLLEVLAEAPIFEHYHQASDSYDKIEERSVEMAAAVVWDTVVRIGGI